MKITHVPGPESAPPVQGSGVLESWSYAEFGISNGGWVGLEVSVLRPEVPTPTYCLHWP